MKRVRAACICQTLQFLLKDGMDNDHARRQVRQEVQSYKDGLERNQTKYRIVEEWEEPDGSIMVKIIKQYNATAVGDYLN